MTKIIKWDDWSGFVPITFTPGTGGEFFAHLMYYRHTPFDPANFPFNKAGKFSFVNEVKPLVWKNDKSLFGWYMKSAYTNTISDHNVLAQRLGIGETFYSSFKSEAEFDKLSHAVAGYTYKYGSEKLNVDNSEFIDFIKNYDPVPLEYDDYQFAAVHPEFRWFHKYIDGKVIKPGFPGYETTHNVWKNAKAIQLYCTPEKGWLFYLLSFNKMYHYYLDYVKMGEGWRTYFFSNLKENFIDRVDNKYAKDYCQPFKREMGPDLHIDSYEMFYNFKDYSEALSNHLEEQFTIPKEALDYYLDINMAIFKHFELDPADNFVPGQVVYDRFEKYGPFHFNEN